MPAVRARALVSRALDLAFPARCAGCDREGEPICAACLSALRVRAGLPGGIPIGLPSDVPAPLLQLEWCAPFDGTVRRALHRLKYAGERRLALPLGRAVGARWREAGVGADLVVPVPVHVDRERERGYDQAVLIADVAARIAHLPMARALVRRRATKAQYSLGHDQRAANMAGAFTLAPAARTGDGRATVLSGRGGHDSLREGGSARADPGRSPVAGHWILLVDDVMTTGSTLAACAEVLLESGAVGVSAVTVARER